MIVDEVDSAFARAQHLIDLRRYEQAAEILERLSDSGHDWATPVLAGCLSDAGLQEEALETARRAVIASPLDATAHVVLAGILHDIGRFDEAVEAAKVAVALSASVPSIVALGEAQASAGECEDAFTTVGKAMALDPLDASVHFAAGTVALKRGRHIDAARHFSRCLELEPRNATARNNLGVSMLRLDTGEGLRHIAMAVKADPSNSVAVSNLRKFQGDGIRQRDRYSRGLYLFLLVVMPGFLLGRWVAFHIWSHKIRAVTAGPLTGQQMSIDEVLERRNQRRRTFVYVATLLIALLAIVAASAL